MIYEVINPSDPVTIEADTDAVAISSNFILGEGMYGLRDESGRKVMPILAMATGEDAEKWLNEQGVNENFLITQREAVARCLQSAVLCDIKDRITLIASVTAAGGDLAAAIEEWNESKRTSLNDICARAHGLAAAMVRPGAELVTP